MRKRISVMLTCIICFTFSIKEAKSWDPPLEIDVVAIQFDFEVGYSYDALNIRKNASSDVGYPEWYPYLNRNDRFAYIKGQSNRQIFVYFQHNQDQGEICNMQVYTTGGGYYPGLVNDSYVYFFPNCDEDASAVLTFTGGTVPNYIQSWGFYLYWYAKKINGQTLDPHFFIGQTGGHNYYVLLSEPQSPMSEPWTDVLDYACVWAKNQSTTANVVKKITEGIYYMEDTDGDIDYDYATYYCTYYDELKLSDFLDDVNSISDVKVNCTDCGNLVNVFTAAVGCQSHSKRIWYGIYTNEIDPIGSSFSWGTVSWSYHQYGWLNNLVNDASLRLDRYGTPRVPTNMSQSDYNTLLIDGDPPPNSQVYTTQIVN